MADHSQEGLIMSIAMHQKKFTRPHPARDSTYMGPDARRAMIAETAYYRAEQRGFDPGHEIYDWLEAEAIVDAEIKRGAAPTV
jgi:hypothetical protein